MNKNVVRTSIAMVVLLVSSFLSWGTIVASSGLSELTNMWGVEGLKQLDKITIKLNGWNSILNLFGLELNNWLIIILGLVLGIFIILNATKKYQANKFVIIFFIVLGLLHLVVYEVVFMLNKSMGIGGALATLSYIALLVIYISMKVQEKKETMQ